MFTVIKHSFRHGIFLLWGADVCSEIKYFKTEMFCEKVIKVKQMNYTF